MGNAITGFCAAAQFVTRKTTPTPLLYAADCAGGVLGMALAATVILPLVGIPMVAGGIVLIKLLTGTVALMKK
jgi:hypothetical protein